MADRLSPLDVSFLYMEEPSTPMHVGGVAIFEVPEEGFDYERLVDLIKERIGLVPRYRQRVRWVPGRLATPVWVDDENFDVTYHVRRSALPRPGTQEQLNELVARIMSRPLDRDRPLWEMYLVEGLEGGRFAILTKTHHAMVDGIAAVDIGQVILDPSPEPRDVAGDEWRPLREPSSIELVAGAVNEIARSPKAVVDTVRTGIGDVHETATQVGRNLVGLAAVDRHQLLGSGHGRLRRMAAVVAVVGPVGPSTKRSAPSGTPSHPSGGDGTYGGSVASPRCTLSAPAPRAEILRASSTMAASRVGSAVTYR